MSELNKIPIYAAMYRMIKVNNINSREATMQKLIVFIIAMIITVIVTIYIIRRQ